MSPAQLVALVLLGVQGGHGGDELDLEVTLRRRALAPELHLDELARELQSAQWTERLRGLEVLARRRRLGEACPAELLPSLGRALSDDHPNVRARALLALPRSARHLLVPGQAQALARDRLPVVRLQLARALGRLLRPGSAELLVELARDGDARVAAAARAALAAFPGDEGARAQGRALERLLEEGDPTAALELAQLVARVPGPAPVLGGFATAFGLGPVLGRARGADPGAPADLLCFLIAERPDDPGRQALFQRAARGMDPALGRDLGAFLERVLWRGAQDPAARRGGAAMRLGIGSLGFRSGGGSGAGDLGSAVALLDLHLADGRAKGLDSLAWALLELRRSGQGEDGLLRQLVDRSGTPGGREAAALAYTLEELGAEVTCLDEAPVRAGLVPWLAPEAPLELRRALLDMLARSLFHHPGDGARELLAAGLGDPEDELADHAFRALAGEAPAASTDPALARHYARRGPGVQLRLARAFRAGTPRPAFRELWITHLEEPGPLALRAAELLAGFAGDDGVCEALLAAGRRAFEEGPGPGEPAPSVRAFLAAAAAVDPEAAVELAWRVLGLRSSDRARERVAAEALGASAAGRARLVEFVDAAVPVDPRLEAALALLASGPDPVALDTILAHEAQFPWSLRRRALTVLARHRGEVGVATYLADLVKAQDSGSVARVAALEALGPPRADADRERLATLFLEATDLDLRKVAVRLLGEGGAGSVPTLLRLLEEAPSYGPGDGARLAREDLLVALAETGAFPGSLVGPWLEGMLARGERRFRARLAGLPVPGLEFAARADLEVARGLLAGGELVPALRALPEPSRLGPELAGALALLALEEQRLAAAEELYALALVGEAGAWEGAAGDRAGARLRWLALGWRAGRDDQVEELASELLVELLEGRVPRGVAGALLGTFRPAAGEDPEGRLASLAPLARARAVLARGDQEGARALLRVAAERRGRSATARTWSHRVEARLAKGESDPKLAPGEPKR